MTTANQSELPFEVIILKTDAGAERLSVAQFLSKSLPERVRLILQGRLTFLQGDVEVERDACLQSLLKARVSAGK